MLIKQHLYKLYLLSLATIIETVIKNLFENELDAAIKNISSILKVLEKIEKYLPHEALDNHELEAFVMETNVIFSYLNKKLINK